MTMKIRDADELSAGVWEDGFPFIELKDGGKVFGRAFLGDGYIKKILSAIAASDMPEDQKSPEHCGWVYAQFERLMEVLSPETDPGALSAALMECLLDVWVRGSADMTVAFEEMIAAHRRHFNRLLEWEQQQSEGEVIQ